MPAEMSFQEKAAEYARQNKAVVVLSILVILLVGYVFTGSKQISLIGAGTLESGYASKGGIVASDRIGIYPPYPPYGDTGPEEYDYKIKTGNIEVESENGLSDSKKVKQKVSTYDGDIRSENKYKTDDAITYYMTARIPSESFEDFSSWMLSEFDVKSSNLQYYTTNVGEIKSEISVLEEALTAYDKLLKELESRPASAETAQAIFEVTRQKLETVRLLKQYGYSIEQVERQANLSTVSISIIEKKEIELIPEEVGRDFMLKLKEAVAIISGIAGGILVVAAKTIKWIVYALVVIIPIWSVYKIARRKFMPKARKM